MENNIYRNKPAIKICGLTKVSEAELLKKYKVEYAGMVLFVEKSKRDISPAMAREIKKALGSIRSVAVTVSPTLLQVKEIEALGVDYIQIHGELKEEIYHSIQTPILRAFNVTNLPCFETEKALEKIEGFVFDGVKAGSGKTFDWRVMQTIDCGHKLNILAGGLKEENVREAITFVHPDVVDVSSGVEGESGKSEEKIKRFVNAVRTI